MGMHCDPLQSQGTPDHTLGRAQKGVEPVSLSFLQAECELDRSFQFSGIESQQAWGPGAKLAKLRKAHGAKGSLSQTHRPLFSSFPVHADAGMLLFRLGDHENSGAVHDF